MIFDKLSQATRVASGAVTFRSAQKRGRFPESRGRFAVVNHGQFEFGDRLKVDAWPIPTKIEVGEGGRLVIGERGYINYGVDINASLSIEIGRNVRIGPLCSIVDDAMHEVDPSTGRTRAPIVIGANVWLGRGVMVLPGVTIGDNSVLGAGSVVTKDVPAGVLAAGVPARVVREVSVPAGWLRT